PGGPMVFADRRRGHSSQQEQQRDNKRDVLPRMPAVATDESDLEHCLHSYTPAGQGSSRPREAPHSCDPAQACQRTAFATAVKLRVSTVTTTKVSMSCATRGRSTAPKVRVSEFSGGGVGARAEGRGFAHSGGS